MRLAGTIKQYSSNAIPHDTNITTTNGQCVEMPEFCNFKCPYQAKVINVLEITNKPIVRSAAVSDDIIL